jgi:hypothetical protein
MDLYTYVAHCNPYQAKAILHKYGYSVRGVNNENDLGVCLKKLVAYEGEDAFNDVLESHPDKGVLIEKHLSETKKDSNTNSCNCNGKCNCNKHDMHYMNFNGAESQASKSTRDVGFIIIASALLLASAIIVKR